MASTLTKLAELEARYDGPIPSEARRAAQYGSLLDSLIAGAAANARFYRDMVVESRRSARAWFRRGDLRMAENCRKDSWLYLTGWRTARKQLAALEAERAALVRNEEAA